MTARLEALTADAILAIPADAPERLYTGSVDIAKREYRRLSSLWHPDRCADARATEVFQWLKDLYGMAEQKLGDGSWETPGLLTVTNKYGKQFEIRYARKLEVDIGMMYIGKTVLAFEIAADNADLADGAERLLNGLTYATPAMKDEFARYFPELIQRIETQKGVVMVFKKTPDLLLLQDVVAHFNGKMPPRHAAWVISRLLNIACYFERQGKLAHNALALDSVFISPKFHSAAVLGGWWFAAGLGSRLTAASRRMTLVAPPNVMRSKLGDAQTDMEMIKALGREMLGDFTGVRLAQDSTVPSALVNWLTLSDDQDAVSAYKEWQERVLIDAFGQRRFVELDLAHETLYP